MSADAVMQHHVSPPVVVVSEQPRAAVQRSLSGAPKLPFQQQPPIAPKAMRSARIAIPHFEASVVTIFIGIRFDIRMLQYSMILDCRHTVLTP